jgi:hypothetical protein
MLKFVVGESFDAIISNFFDVDITVVFLQALTHCCPISTWASCYRHYKGLLTPTTQIPICCLSVPLLPILLSPQDACTFIIIFLKRPLRWHWVNFLDSFFFCGAAVPPPPVSSTAHTFANRESERIAAARLL